MALGLYNEMKHSGTRFDHSRHKLHRVSKKCANLFLSEFRRQISTIFENFWQNDGKEAKIMRGALNFHSSNLRYPLTTVPC